jgi:hypothetical protein
MPAWSVRRPFSILPALALVLVATRGWAGAEGAGSGRRVVPPRERPEAETPVVGCSHTRPVCVHAGASVADEHLAEALGAAEAAMKTFDAMGLPRPLPDGARGGSPAFDVYLVPGERSLETSFDLDVGLGFDRASAFAIVSPPARPGTCEMADAVTRAVAHGITMGLDAGADEGAAAMFSAYLSVTGGTCEVGALQAVDEFQRSPERAIAMGAGDGAFLFPWYLDHTFGHGPSGTVMAGLLSIAVQRTPPGSWDWGSEPDVYDALRASLKPRGKTLDGVLLEFALARAFVGSRSDGAHLPDVDRFGDLGRVRFEWSLPYDSLPRRVAPSLPIEPTGATYLWIDLATAPKGADITFVAEWELPVLFRWALVKVDRSGAEVGRVDIAGINGATRVERTVVGVDGLAGIVVVGVNAGSMDRSHPFDPDDTFVSHGYTVFVAK